MHSLTDKATLRWQCIEARLALAPGYVAEAAKAIAAHLLAMGSAPGIIVAGYRAIRGEVDISQAMSHFAAHGCQCALPVVEEKGRPLRFLRWQPGDRLVKAAYGVEIPASGEPVVPHTVLVPLLAFDSACHRLGYGAGYYDRTLASLRASGRKVRAFGVAYAAQKRESLPRDPHDMCLDAVVTEEGIAYPA